MDLTVLGASSRYLAPLGAGTSYLLRAGDARVLLDCGNGTHLRLAHELGEERLSAVLVSHFHLDNVADLLPVAFSLPAGAPLYVPRGALPRLADLLRGYSMDRSWIENARIVGVGRGSQHEVTGIRLDFAKAGHGCPGVATRLEADGRSLVYLGDTGPRPWLADLARGADLVVAHTLLLDRDEGAARGTNMTAGDAGRLAREAGARRLALSHVPFYRNADESAAEAKEAFGGEVVVLREGQRLAVD
ncbi:MAG TPA: MBL fold metallo-hydrolase [Candidatus Thermoplasmatota archaeon]|nr:MBL fold metallo-hydrolase [Candidatus Thermoplasmatota archaeon]